MGRKQSEAGVAVGIPALTRLLRIIRFNCAIVRASVAEDQVGADLMNRLFVQQVVDVDALGQQPI